MGFGTQQPAGSLANKGHADRMLLLDVPANRLDLVKIRTELVTRSAGVKGRRRKSPPPSEVAGFIHNSRGKTSKRIECVSTRAVLSFLEVLRRRREKMQHTRVDFLSGVAVICPF